MYSIKMKRYNYILIALVVMAITIVSCSKFPDVTPVEGNKVDNTPEATMIIIGEDKPGNGGITDPDNDEEHDEDEISDSSL